MGSRPNLGVPANCCAETLPDGGQQLHCTNPLWNSPPGIYPGYPACGPGEGGTAPAPPAPSPGPGPGGGGQQPACPAQQFWDGTQCRPSVGTIPGGGGLPGVPQPPGGGAPPATTPPAGNPPVPVVGGCPLPADYGPQPNGGAAVGKAVVACPVGNGKYNVLSVYGGAPILTDVDQACLNQFGDVTMALDGDSRCGGPPAAQGPTTGPCALASDKKYIKCPPSNGVTVDYYLEVDTAGYTQNMTTQSPECANQSNVISVGADSPYCGGSNVSGPGSGPPQLVACFKQPGMTHEEAIVDIHNGPDYALLASDIMVKDINTRFPGKRWIMVTSPHCSALPDFGTSSATPTPAPAPTPAPSTTPTGTPISPQIPTGGGPLPTTPMQQVESALPTPMTQTYSTQPTGAWGGSPFSPPPSSLIPARTPVRNVPLPPAAPPGPPPPPPWVPCSYGVKNIAPWVTCLIQGA